MKSQNKFGEPVFSQADLLDAVLSGHDVFSSHCEFVVTDIDPEALTQQLTSLGLPPVPVRRSDESLTMEQFDATKQDSWFMPQQYRDLDIAQYVLQLCQTQPQLQRVGEELLLYQERNLFDLLRYLKFLVDTMNEHGVIWGVGRGSSVASYVLYLLGVHRIDSMFYELNPREFLR